MKSPLTFYSAVLSVRNCKKECFPWTLNEKKGESKKRWVAYMVYKNLRTLDTYKYHKWGGLINRWREMLINKKGDRYIDIWIGG